MKSREIDSVWEKRIPEIVRRRIEMADKRKAGGNTDKDRAYWFGRSFPFSSVRGIAFPSFDLVKRKNNKRFHLSWLRYPHCREEVRVSSQA